MSEHPFNPEQEVEIAYINWKGDFEVRRIVPHHLFWGSNEWHKEEQWLLEAYDVDKKAMRTFAMSGIGVWRPRGKGRRRRDE